MSSVTIKRSNSGEFDHTENTKKLRLTVDSKVLLELPPEILHHIVQLVPMRQRAMARLVCKRLKDVVDCEMYKDLRRVVHATELYYPKALTSVGIKFVLESHDETCNYTSKITIGTDHQSAVQHCRTHRPGVVHTGCHALAVGGAFSECAAIGAGQAVHFLHVRRGSSKSEQETVSIRVCCHRAVFPKRTDTD